MFCEFAERTKKRSTQRASSIKVPLNSSELAIIDERRRSACGTDRLSRRVEKIEKSLKKLTMMMNRSGKSNVKPLAVDRMMSLELNLFSFSVFFLLFSHVDLSRELTLGFKLSFLTDTREICYRFASECATHRSHSQICVQSTTKVLWKWLCNRRPDSNNKR